MLPPTLHAAGRLNHAVHALRLLASLLITLVVCGADPVWAQACGAEGQAACPVWRRIPSCDANLVEKQGRCIRLPCGQLGQRACGFLERLPSCDPGLAEFAGQCFLQGACGMEGQRPCTVVERFPSCEAGLVERDQLCKRLDCGRGGERACGAFERLPSCDPGLVEYQGRCRVRGACGAEGQRPCLFYERIPACQPSLAEDAGQCRRIACGRLGERPCGLTEAPSRCALGLIEHQGRCVTRGDCGGQGQRSCAPGEQPTTCDAPLEDQQGLCQVAFDTKLTIAAGADLDRPGPVRVVRASNAGAVRMAAIDGMVENDATDAEFHKRRGLSDANCMSFESTQRPGHYLRHHGGRIRLARFSALNTAFAPAATFCLNTPQGGGARPAYEAYDRRGWYVVTSGSDLILEPLNSSSAYPADFDRARLQENSGPATLFLQHRTGLSAVVPASRQGDYQVALHLGPCSPPMPWWWIFTGQRPAASSVVWVLQYHGRELQGRLPPVADRVVSAEARSNPLTRFQPFMRFYMPWRDGMNPLDADGTVAKIETGRLPCLNDGQTPGD